MAGCDAAAAAAASLIIPTFGAEVASAVSTPASAASKDVDSWALFEDARFQERLEEAAKWRAAMMETPTSAAVAASPSPTRQSYQQLAQQPQSSRSAQSHAAADHEHAEVSGELVASSPTAAMKPFSPRTPRTAVVGRVTDKVALEVVKEARNQSSLRGVVDVHGFSVKRTAWRPAPDASETQTLDVPYDSYVPALPISSRGGLGKTFPRGVRVRTLMKGRLGALDKVEDYTYRGVSLTVARAHEERRRRHADKGEEDTRELSAPIDNATAVRPPSDRHAYRRKAAPGDLAIASDAEPVPQRAFECDITRGTAAGWGELPAKTPLQSQRRQLQRALPKEESSRTRAAWMQGDLERPVRPARWDWASVELGDLMSTSTRPGQSTVELIATLRNVLKKQPPEKDALLQIGAALELRSYDLLPGDALLAMSLLLDGTRCLDGQNPTSRRASRDAQLLGALRTNLKMDSACEAMYGFINRLAFSIVGRFLSAPPSVLAEVLTAMAETKLAAQEYIDAALSRLLLLLRTDPISVKLPMLVQIASALGNMKRDGGLDGCQLCARAGASTRQQEVNRRCLSLLNLRIASHLHECSEEHLQALLESYALQYMSEDELRLVIGRGAQLQMGLRSISSSYAPLLCSVLQIAALRWPEFRVTLPRSLRDYCHELEQSQKKKAPHH